MKHPSLYYHDGSIVLIAENTKFRVYGGHLARRSNIFKDMITIGQPQGSEMVDGCPAVRLDDLAVLVGHFLEIMLNGVQATREPSYPSWPQVKALLELGTKYEVDDLLSEGMSLIQSWFPGNISKWDESPRVRDVDNYFEWIDMANTCRKLDLRPLHVKVLYFCCNMPNDYLINGCPDDPFDSDDDCSLYDSTTSSTPESSVLNLDLDTSQSGGENRDNDTQDNPTSQNPDPAAKQAQVAKLDASDILTCLNARPELSAANAQWALLVSRRDPPKKDDPSDVWRDCKEGQKELQRKLFRNSEWLVSYDSLVGFTKGYFENLGLCSNCISFYLRVSKEQRQKVLDRLEKLIEPNY